MVVFLYICSKIYKNMTQTISPIAINSLDNFYSYKHSNVGFGKAYKLSENTFKIVYANEREDICIVFTADIADERFLKIWSSDPSLEDFIYLENYIEKIAIEQWKSR